MYLAVDLLALGTACLALFFCLRLKQNYLFDPRFFISLANLGFIVTILQTAISRMVDVPASMVLFVVLSGIMAASVGFASFLLDRNGGPGLDELTGFVKRPPVIFSIYMGIVVSWTLASAILQPFQLRQMIGSEGRVFYYNYDTWWLGYTGVLLGSFLAMPVYSLYKQSRQIRDSKVVRSMRMLVIGWTGFGIIEFVQGTAGAYSILVQDLGMLVDALLFVLISLALREHSLLGRIMSGSEGVGQIVYSPESDTVVLYKTDADRWRLLEGIVAGAQARKWEMVFFVPKGDVPLYTAIIMGTGSRSFSRMRKFGVEPLDVLLKGAGEDSETIKLGLSGQVREFVDMGNIGSNDVDRIANMAVAHAGHLRSPRVGRIWALKAADSSGELVDRIRKNSPGTRVIDLAGQQELFSSLLGLQHSELLGKRILLEYEPSTNFEQLAVNFALEFQANVEPVAVFTSPGSPVYRRAKENGNIRLFTASTQTSTPLRISGEEVLIPDRDVSLLLDSMDKLLLAYHGRSVGIAMDLVTDLILSLGFDKTYGVLSSVSEMCEIEKATLLLLVNHGALDESALNGVRGLFRFHLRYDPEGLKRVRLPETGQGRVDAPVQDLNGHNVQVPIL